MVLTSFCFSWKASINILASCKLTKDIPERGEGEERHPKGYRPHFVWLYRPQRVCIFSSTPHPVSMEVGAPHLSMAVHGAIDSSVGSTVVSAMRYLSQNSEVLSFSFRTLASVHATQRGPVPTIKVERKKPITVRTMVCLVNPMKPEQTYQPVLSSGWSPGHFCWTFLLHPLDCVLLELLTLCFVQPFRVLFSLSTWWF